MKRIGFIDYYLDEWHANNYPQLIKEVSGGELEVTCAYAVIDSPRHSFRSSRRTARSSRRVLESIGTVR